MKIRCSTMAPWLGAMLCLAVAPAARAGDDAETSKAPASQPATTDPKAGEQGMQPAGIPYDNTRERSANTQSEEGPPTRINKARDILGMDVRNQYDEHLGHIKDLVVDWKNEQVSYAVLSTAPKVTFGLGGKMLAVPLTALIPSADHKYLILNANKAKVQAATGFSSANWPSVGNPSWGAQPFWQQGPATPADINPPAKQPDIQRQQNMTPGASPAQSPESNSGHEPDAAPAAK